MSTEFAFDVLVIGSGAAGLSLAARLNPSLKVAVLCKSQLQEGSSFYAQGGVAAVMDVNDSIESHVEDTMKAGRGLCDEAAIRFTVANARKAIEWLVDKGVNFDKITLPDGREDFHLTQEGGHSYRRILHAADATGQEVTSTLTGFVRRLPHVQIFEHYIAVDLLMLDKHDKANRRCVGAYALNTHRNQVDTFHAKQVVLATGGASKVYLYSSNPDVSSGDGIAIAWRAGARIGNMEFNQFHPTCLYHPEARNFLISEALRGEGALLKLPNGERFMQNFDERAELAPRDTVARAIDHEMKRLGLSHVLLDISHKAKDFIINHFPNIYQRCLQYGIDITQQPIPVVPAAHYTCGGVITDLDGRTDILGLYAVGEVACTGLHGANRMASNSLLECLVFAMSASEHINQHHQSIAVPPSMPAWDESQVTDSDEQVVISHNWNELRHFMWDYVGIVRSNKRLERAKRRVDLLQQEINEYYSAFKVNSDLLELRNLVIIADLIIRSAQSRHESRGLHYNLDYPETDSSQPPHMTVLTPEI